MKEAKTAGFRIQPQSCGIHSSYCRLELLSYRCQVPVLACVLVHNLVCKNSNCHQTVGSQKSHSRTGPCAFVDQILCVPQQFHNKVVRRREENINGNSYRAHLVLEICKSITLVQMLTIRDQSRTPNALTPLMYTHTQKQTCQLSCVNVLHYIYIIYRLHQKHRKQ